MNKHTTWSTSSVPLENLTWTMRMKQKITSKLGYMTSIKLKEVHSSKISIQYNISQRTTFLFSYININIKETKTMTSSKGPVQI